MTAAGMPAGDPQGARPPAAGEAEAALGALPQPILVVGPDDVVRYVNPAAEQFFQAGASVLCRTSLPDLVPFGSPLLSLVEEARRGGQSMSEYDVALGTPRAGMHAVNINVAPIVENPGCVLVALQETSIASKIDRQLLHRGASRMVAGMASVLAHEIKNPLSGIRGAAQLLEQGASAADQVFTRLICDEADRIVGIVDRMEMFSDKPIEREPVNIHQVLERVRMVAQAGFAADVRFVEQYDPSLPLVHGNFDQLVQSFLNLVKNAAEAVPSGHGEILLSTAFRHGVRLAVPGSRARMRLPLEVCVQDNGAGVPEDLLAHLFDPFVTTKPKGCGLGLALVAKIVDAHGGIVECESRPRRTVFRVLLPMLEEDAT